MLALGWHGALDAEETEFSRTGFGAHDAAAVLVRDGEILAAIEEERLGRVKHTNFFPARAVRHCLESAGVGLEEVDLVVTDSSYETLLKMSVDSFLFDAAEREPMPEGMIGACFARALGVDVRDKVRFAGHHQAHTWAAYYASGYRHALVVSIDGDGDQLSGMVSRAEGKEIEELATYSADNSLGNFYTRCIQVLGYKRFDEYKVMGLAPYGDPETFRGLFEQLYTLLPEGGYEIAPDERKLEVILGAGLLARCRRQGEPFSQAHKDFAAGLQATLERIAFHVIGHWQRITGERTLCLSGGVVHNCTMNGKLLYSGLFDRVFALPVAHDAGNAYGAALVVLEKEGVELEPRRLEHLFYGTDMPAGDAIGTELAAWGELIEVEKVEDPEKRAAQLIAEGSVIAWVQGRSEFGPRALGNRSILADPRPAENKRIINQMVKKREGYRPFAPSVAAEHLADYFVIPEGREADYEFMIFVLDVREEMREKLGAITHVDGTARVQSVDRTSNPRYWKLIHEVGKLTGIPMVLNTSFNNNAEPIVDSVEDAVTCFLTTGLHYLVVGDYVVAKKGLADDDARFRRLVPGLRPSRKLVRGARFEDGEERAVHSLEATASLFFNKLSVEVSKDLYDVLLLEEGSLDERCTALGIRDERRLADLTREAVDLWQRRALVLRPAR